MRRIDAIAVAIMLCATLHAQGPALEAPNLLTNPDFSAGLDEEGKPVGWAYWVKGGEPTTELVEDPEGAYFEVTVPDLESNSRMSQPLALPAGHFYRASVEVRCVADGDVPPEVAIRLAFPTPIGLWRIWERTDPALGGEWQTLVKEFVVPNEPEIGDLKLHLGNNGEPGVIQIRSASVVEIPLTDYQRENVHVTEEGHRYFPEQTASPPAPDYPEELRQAGLFWWQPADRDGATPWDTMDTQFDALLQRLVLSAPAGGRDSAVVVLEATRDVEGVRLDFRDQSMRGLTLTFRKLRVWRQRAGHRGGFYHEVPELLEPLPETVDLKAGERLQVLITASASRDVGAGAWHQIMEANAQSQGRPMAARAFFELVAGYGEFDLAPSPEDVVWGLYPDPGRWKRYTDEQLRDELVWLNDCGINSMLLYVLAALDLPDSLTDENVDQALADWRVSLEEWADRYIAPLYGLGYGPTLVANMQSLDRMLARAMGVAITEDGVYNQKLLEYDRRFLQVLEDLRVERGWPEFTWHMIDEPGIGRNVAASAEFALIDSMGLRGFTTANKPAVIRDFADVLDDFCASCGALDSREKAERAHEWLAHRDDANLWMYGGAGTYTGQEGAMAPNRWGTGFLTWRNGATGQFFWTFQRTSGDPFDDFDGKRGKDFCLTYPDPDGGASLSTLQWEGVCEGIVDYRHLVTLEAEIARAREEGRADAANRAAAEGEALRDELWAQEEPPSNRMLDEWRAHVARWIVQLQPKQ